MDASSRSLPHLAEYDSFFFDESSGRLVHSVGHSFRISTSPSFIDLYPDDLFSIFLSSPATSDFDFDLHPPVVDDAPPSPVLQTSASRIFHDGRLLPCDPGGGSCAEADGDGPVTSQHHTADVPSAPWSSAFSSPSTPVPRSPCSTATSKHARPRPTTLCAGRRRAGSSPWKVLRFVMPLYRKVRAIARRHRRFTLAASPARGATSSNRYHGSADTDAHDAILYCKKSNGSGVQETNRMSATF
ncbi:hypothetical protein VPH35_075217 [Triticum aestivum]